ncbi:MAG: hypothetical protein VX075_06620, partial [Pseudomonadota bacterium]|nr:hypothetical protein [Pseudomonadota bacterium]
NKNLRETIFQNYNQKIIEGKFVPNIIPKLKKRKLVAFCGIGRRLSNKFAEVRSKRVIALVPG